MEMTDRVIEHIRRSAETGEPILYRPIDAQDRAEYLRAARRVGNYPTWSMQTRPEADTTIISGVVDGVGRRPDRPYRIVVSAPGLIVSEPSGIPLCDSPGIPVTP